MAPTITGISKSFCKLKTLDFKLFHVIIENLLVISLLLKCVADSVLQMKISQIQIEQIISKY